MSGAPPSAAFSRAAALRGYYLARPPCPGRFSCAAAPVHPACRPPRPSRDGRSRTACTTSTAGCSRLIADLAGEPVPFLGLWPAGRSWALVLTHDVETAVGYRDMDLLRAPERARGYRSSWNFVGARYQVDDETVRSLQDDGCESRGARAPARWPGPRRAVHGRAAAGHVGARQPMERCRVPVAGHAPGLGTDAPARIRLRLVLHRHRPVRAAAGRLLHLSARISTAARSNSPSPCRRITPCSPSCSTRTRTCGCGRRSTSATAAAWCWCLPTRITPTTSG